jgi:hypothetical protein
MREIWLTFGWGPGTDHPVVFGAHATEESARLDCPADIHDADGWVVEGVAPLGSDPYLLEGLRDHLELMRDVEGALGLED